MSAPAQLFDVPGPRARAQQRLIALVVAVVAIGLAYLAVQRLMERGTLDAAKWQPFLTSVVWQQYLLPGLRHTLLATVLSVTLAGVLGLLLGMGRLSQIAPVRWVCSIFVEFFRSVPVLVMMIFSFWMYSFNRIFLPDVNPLAATVTGLTLYNAAVLAELIRSGVQNLPKGQAEGGLSIGLTPSQTLRAIQLPQALTAMLPALVGQLVVILKDSALGYQITFAELLQSGELIGAAYGNILPALAVVAVIFILLNTALTSFAQWLERRLSRRGHVAGGVMGADPVVDRDDAPAHGGTGGGTPGRR